MPLLCGSRSIMARNSGLMLEMKANCERCEAATPPDGDATICSYECTWCVSCAKELRACPNCGGELRERPKRSA